MKLTILCLCIIGFLVSNVPVNLSSGPLTVAQVNEPLTRNKRSIIDFSVLYCQDRQHPRDCQEVYEQCEGETESGIYTIQPDESPEPFKVYCNNSIDGGKWTVFQRRVDGSVVFHRNWTEFKNGFGFLNREFWLGNDNLAYLTAQKDYELRIDMNNVDGDSYFAKYNLFRISDEGSDYRLVDLGEYLSESTASNDAMGTSDNKLSRNMSFTTYDRDNDRHSSANCASQYRGAWWHNGCTHAHLNGLYFGCSGCYESIRWYDLPGSYYNVKYVEMKLRAK